MEVHDVPDVSSYAVGGGGLAEVENGRYIGCNARLKRGSGVQNNIAEGRLLVAEEQTLRGCLASVVVEVVLVVENVNEGRRKS